MPYAGTSFGRIHFTMEEMMELDIFTFKKFIINKLGETPYDYAKFYRETLMCDDTELVKKFRGLHQEYYDYVVKYCEYQRSKRVMENNLVKNEDVLKNDEIESTDMVALELQLPTHWSHLILYHAAQSLVHKLGWKYAVPASYDHTKIYIFKHKPKFDHIDHFELETQGYTVIHCVDYYVGTRVKQILSQYDRSTPPQIGKIEWVGLGPKISGFKVEVSSATSLTGTEFFKLSELLKLEDEVESNESE